MWLWLFSRVLSSLILFDTGSGYKEKKYTSVNLTCQGKRKITDVPTELENEVFRAHTGREGYHYKCHFAHFPDRNLLEI